MPRCEDWPCCGHEANCCPNYEAGKQTNMVCTCGQRLAVTSRYSICAKCLAAADKAFSDVRDYRDYNDWRNDNY